MNHQSIRRATAALAAGGLAVTGMLAAAPGAWATEGQDGQPVVYPANIRDSQYTTTYQTL